MKDKKIELLIVFLLLCTLFFVIGNKGSDNDGWDLDYGYTTRLVANVSLVEGNIVSSMDTIDSLQLFSVNNANNNLLPLNEARKKQFVFESSEKAVIREFMSSIYESTEVSDCVNRDSKTIHVYAYDKNFLRAANFLIYICESRGNKVAKILVPDEKLGMTSIYSARLIDFMSKNINY